MSTGIPAFSFIWILFMETLDTRWGTGTRADSQFARDQILEAACNCYLRLGVNKTSVETVAKEAKVSRTTVYRYFANRDELLTALVIRESEHLMDLVKRGARGIDNLADFMVEGVVLVLIEAPKMRTHELFFGAESNSITNRLCVSSEEVFAIGLQLIEPLHKKAVAEGDIPATMTTLHVIEWTVRLLLSYWSNPNPMMNTEEQLRDMFRMFLRPALKGNGDSD
jgi:AcrR family transcriptional regulator